MQELKLPKLYAKAKTGNIKTCEIWVQTVDEFTTRILTMAASKEDGAVTEHINLITSGKNIGKANETSIWEQAVLEAESKHRKKKDQGYVEDRETVVNSTFNTDASGFIKPMLAKEYKEGAAKFPAIIQPKFDGVRCLAFVTKGSVKLLSRSGKEYKGLDHIVKELLQVRVKSIILDGELYSDEITFQEITAAVKKVNENTPKIKYRCYDVVDIELNQAERIAELFLALGEIQEDRAVSPVMYQWADGEDGVKYWHDKYVSEGYEGAMVRNTKALYEPGFRSRNLLKVKQFDDNEFMITGMAIGERGVEDMVFKCVTEDGKAFDCKPMGNRELKQKYWDEDLSLSGKMLTVKHFGWTDDGLPRFPVGKTIRDYE